MLEILRLLGEWAMDMLMIQEVKRGLVKGNKNKK